MFKGAVCSDCHRHALSVTPSVWGDCVTPLSWTFFLHDPSRFPSPTWQQGWSYDCLYFMIVGGSERRGKGHAHPRRQQRRDAEPDHWGLYKIHKSKGRRALTVLHTDVHAQAHPDTRSQTLSTHAPEPHTLQRLALPLHTQTHPSYAAGSMSIFSSPTQDKGQRSRGGGESSA